ncbi:MAG: addiction module protein [Longimicrobiales bacterium]
MTPVEELESAVLSLPRGERARLAERLIASLDEDPEVEAAWKDEVRRRLARYRAGETDTYPAEDVLREARESLGS